MKSLTEQEAQIAAVALYGRDYPLQIDFDNDHPDMSFVPISSGHWVKAWLFVPAQTDEEGHED